MKKLFFVLLPYLLFISCTKDVELNPDLASKVVGVYKATYADINKTASSLPSPDVSIGLRLDWVDVKTVDCTLITTIAGKKSETSGNLNLEGSKDKIRLLISGSEFGYITGNELTVQYVNQDGSKVFIKANKNMESVL